MEYLPFPFEKSCLLCIHRKGEPPALLEAELANTAVEIYQAWQYREAADCPRPLVLLFHNPYMKYRAMSHYPFATEFIGVRKDGQVQDIHHCPAGSTYNNLYSQGFENFGAMIVARQGFSKHYGILLRSSQVVLFDYPLQKEQPRLLQQPFVNN